MIVPMIYNMAFHFTKRVVNAAENGPEWQDIEHERA